MEDSKFKSFYNPIQSPEYAVGQGCSQNCYENRLKVFLDIINEAKAGEQ